MELIHCPGGGGAGLRPENGPNDPKMMLPRCIQTPGAPPGTSGWDLEVSWFYAKLSTDQFLETC